MALKCFRHNSERFAILILGRLLKCTDDLVIIMSIDRQHLKIKSFKPVYVFFNMMTKHGFLTLPKAVDVKYSNKVIQFFVSREISRFPNLTFGQFSVAREHKCFAWIPFTF